MEQNNSLLLNAIASVRTELQEAHKRRASWMEIAEIMQRLINLYSCLETDHNKPNEAA